MQVEVNGTRLWFDVDGPALVPDGPGMVARPTLILVHGGPGGYDHSYFKPHFAPLTAVAQVVYLDLRDHGRSARHDPSAWSFEACADDLRAFCDAVGIAEPIVDELARITCPTLVCVGELDSVTPVAAAEEIVAALPPGIGRLEVFEGAGHFPWLDAPERFRSVIGAFVR